MQAKQNKIYICFLLITCVLVFSTFALGDKYSIGVENVPYLPHYSIENNKYVGFSREVFDAFSLKTGILFDYHPMPIYRLNNLFINKELDFLYPHNPDWQSEEMKTISIYYSEPAIDYVLDGLVVLAKNKGMGIGGLKRIGTILGYTAPPYEKFFSDKTMIKDENPIFTGLLRQVISGRVDAAYVTIDSSFYLLKDMAIPPDKTLAYDPDLPSEISKHFLATIKHPKVIEVFNKFLIDEKEAIEQLRKKHGIGAKQ